MNVGSHGTFLIERNWSDVCYTELVFDFVFFFQITLLFYIGFLLFEDFPASVIICGIISQVAHLFILKTFPFVAIASPAFIVALIMLIVNHYLAFQYFAAVYYSFSEVCSSFTSTSDVLIDRTLYLS
jgi:hypothetical protein